eukprot:m.25070 g.25070  ORF g.25070 m.25070 type:complete len:56 (-) comp14862_c0_seq1:392-559(-)
MSSTSTAHVCCPTSQSKTTCKHLLSSCETIHNNTDMNSNNCLPTTIRTSVSSFIF